MGKKKQQRKVTSLQTEAKGDTELTAAALAATNELLATAKELYRSLGGGSEDGLDGDDGSHDEEEDGSDDIYNTEFASRVREAAAALVPADMSSIDRKHNEHHVELNVQNSNKMAPPPPPPPSSVSIGKKPMAYQPAATAAPPRSARAAAKAPVTAAYPPEPVAANAKGKQPATAPPSAAVNNKIWSTSSSEERERIRDFWLALGEDERRDLVRIEKDMVLRKMKEEQKHSCSCAVCGRKRTAIEDELQVLYDAYYEDLEQYALYQQQYLSSNRTLPPPPGPGPFPGSVEVDRYGAVVAGYPPPSSATLHPSVNKGAPKGGGKGAKGRKGRRRARKNKGNNNTNVNGNGGEVDEEEDDEDDVYEEPDPDEEEDLDDEESVPPPVAPVVNGRGRGAVRGGAPGGRGGGGVGRGAVDMKGKITAAVGAGAGGPTSILTVADDLLKNDGRKFLEMMEQLAERRLAREEEAAGDLSADEDSASSLDGEGDESSDGDGEDESEADDDDESGDSGDDDESGEEDEDDEDGEEVMTEEQKMEEGKRMFSIFAARMFEQRVLKAYRERVAQDRQLQLLRELADESEREREKEQKKASQNRKKKEKKLQQKQVKEEKEAARAAEKAAEEAAAKVKQAAMEEEQRKRREEERLKREAMRKTQEEEKAKKDEEKRKRLAEEKEKEAEREKKRREKEEKSKAERKEREEKERKAREEREAKAAKEKAAQAAAAKEKEEKERERKRIAKEKEEKEAKEKAEKERAAQQQRAASAAKAANAARAAAVTSPTPTRNSNAGPSNAVASGSRPAPTTNGNGLQPKKILNKQSAPILVPAAAPVSPPMPVAVPTAARHMSPPHQHQQPRAVPPLHAHTLSMSHPPQPQTPLTPQMHMPPAPMFAGQQPPISPRNAYVPTPAYNFGPGPSSIHPGQQIPVTPRGFVTPSSSMGSAVGFDPSASTSSFHRGVPASGSLPLVSSPVPAPIGPPPKLAPGANRRASLLADPSPGPITRPAPIARPTPAGDSGSGSGSASPARRSPSPKGVLGSSALLADDDEVVPVRRTVGPPVGQSWGAPGSAGRGAPAPWGAPGAGAAFNGPIGAGRGQAPGGLWGTTAIGNPTQEWHPAMANFYPRGAYLSNPASPPHSGGS